MPNSPAQPLTTVELVDWFLEEAAAIESYRLLLTADRSFTTEDAQVRLEMRPRVRELAYCLCAEARTLNLSDTIVDALGRYVVTWTSADYVAAREAAIKVRTEAEIRQRLPPAQGQTTDTKWFGQAPPAQSVARPTDGPMTALLQVFGETLGRWSDLGRRRLDAAEHGRELPPNGCVICFSAVRCQRPQWRRKRGPRG